MKSGITVHQRGYIENMVTKFKADPNSKTTSPTSSDFLTYDENDDKIDATKYLVTHLATKLADPTRQSRF